MRTATRRGSTNGATEALGRQRAYNSQSMADRRSRIIAATLATIEEDGLAKTTIRTVSKRAGVALRTLYLYFDNREAMISIAIKEFFHQSVEAGKDEEGPATLDQMLERFDRLSDVIEGSRAYSAALAPIYFSTNLDSRIYDILRNIALSHVFPYLDICLKSARVRPNMQMKDLICTHIANTEYAVINDALAGRLPEDRLGLCLKIAVLSCIAGFIPKPPKDLVAALQELQAAL